MEGAMRRARPRTPALVPGPARHPPRPPGTGASAQRSCARCSTAATSEGLGAYLESSKESNVPFYRRHGFEVTGRLDAPGGAPPLHLMWRDPR